MRCLLCFVVLVLSAPPCLAQNAELNEAEQAFADLMTGAVMVGRFSVDGRETPPKEERYEISKAQKLGGDKWLITARIKYGQNDIEVPVAVQMNWAGDTPVLSVTDIAIPGLGEGFTTRLLFYRDRYAGSWYHGEAGGHMWGTIEKAKEGDDVSEVEMTPRQRQILERLEERVNATFHETPLRHAVAYLENATDIPMTFAAGIPERNQQLPVEFVSLHRPYLGHLLPRILSRYGLGAYVDDDGIEIRRLGSDGVIAVTAKEEPHVREALQKTIPTEFVRIRLRDAADFIEDVAQVDIEMTPGVSGDLLITFDGTGMSVKDVLSQMLSDLGLEAHVDLGRILIRPTGGKFNPVHQRMGNLTEYEFQDAPLHDVADYFSKRHGIPVALAPRVEPGTPITAVDGKIPLYSALEDILRSHQLRPVVIDGGIVIKAAEN